MSQFVFPPGSSHTAQVSITVTPSGQAMQGQVWLSTSSTLTSKPTGAPASSMVPFTSTGSSQNVSFTVTLPSTGGPWYAYLDVYEGSTLAGEFVDSTDTVAIINIIVGPITWS